MRQPARNERREAAAGRMGVAIQSQRRCEILGKASEREVDGDPWSMRVHGNGKWVRIWERYTGEPVLINETPSLGSQASYREMSEARWRGELRNMCAVYSVD